LAAFQVITEALNKIFAIAIFLGLLLSQRLLGQEQGTPIPFHVTAVRSEDVSSDKAYEWCNGCDVTRHTVEGYSEVKGNSHVTEYVLECDDIFVSTPSPHYIDVCDRLHADNDYDARLLPTAIAFGPVRPHSDGEPTALAYDIKSEKESRKQKQ
jgi:hypothetical protein